MKNTKNRETLPTIIVYKSFHFDGKRSLKKIVNYYFHYKSFHFKSWKNQWIFWHFFFIFRPYRTSTRIISSIHRRQHCGYQLSNALYNSSDQKQGQNRRQTCFRTFSRKCEKSSIWRRFSALSDHPLDPNARWFWSWRFLHSCFWRVFLDFDHQWQCCQTSFETFEIRSYQSQSNQIRYVQFRFTTWQVNFVKLFYHFTDFRYF